MTQENLNNPLAAGRAMVAAMIIIAAIDNFVGQIAEVVSLWEFLLLRMIMALVFVTGLSLLGFGSMRTRRPGRVLLRGALVATGMFFYFGSLGFVSISQALAGLYTAPLFVLLISAVLLKRRVGPWRISAVLLGFVGILTVIGPRFSDLGWFSLFPVIGGFFYAAGAVPTRELCRGENNFAMLWGMFVVQGVVALLALGVLAVSDPVVPEGAVAYLLRDWVWPVWEIMPQIALQAVGSVIAVAFIIRAYQVAEASHATVFEYSVFIFGPLFAWAFWGQTIGLQEILGIALITFSGLIIVFRSPAA